MKEHVAQRGKTWTYWIDVGKDATGKRQRETKGGFTNEAEARRAARRRMVDVELEDSARSKETLGAFMTRWLESVQTRTKPSTYAQYSSLTRTHIIPALGATPLSKLSLTAIEAFYTELLHNGRRCRCKDCGDGTWRKCVRKQGRAGLAASTVGHVHTTLHDALEYAFERDLLVRNPAAKAKPPKKSPTAMSTWTPEEARRFLAHVADDRLYAAYAIALTTGLRRGELLGLAWRDIDLAGRRLNVRQTIVSVDFEVQMSTPKTSSGRRFIALDDTEVQKLTDHRLRQLKERTLLELPAQQPDDLVFSQLEGEPLHPALFTDAFDRRVKASKVPRIRFQDMRHTAATLALAAGVPHKVVQERLGHASVAITMDRYTHSVPELQQEAAAKVAALVFGG